MIRIRKLPYKMMTITNRVPSCHGNVGKISYFFPSLVLLPELLQVFVQNPPTPTISSSALAPNLPNLPPNL